MGTMDGLIGKPVLLDKLDATLAAKISTWIAKDNQRALDAKARRRARKKAKAEPAGG